MPTEWVTCALGPYNFEFMTSVIQEIMTLYKVDGVFANRWSGSGMCYCRALPAEFQGIQRLGTAASQRGRARPTTRAPNSPHGRRNACWICIRSGMARSGSATRKPCSSPTDSTRYATAFRSRFSLRTGSAAPEFQLPWQNGKFAKDARSTSGSKPIVGIFSVGIRGALPLEGFHPEPQ